MLAQERYTQAQQGSGVSITVKLAGINRMLEKEFNSTGVKKGVGEGGTNALEWLWKINREIKICFA